MTNFTSNLSILLANITQWFTVPRSAPEMNRRNFRNVQIDAVGVGLASTAAPLLPVFLRRMEATPLQLSMLTFMPAVTGLLLSIPLGQFLQTRRNIVPWFSAARLAVLSSYALTGLASIFMPEKLAVFGVLTIWAVATIPQSVLNITFSVVMNSVAGPAGRYELMTHRWSILGFTNAVTALAAAQFLAMLPYPLNFQLMFITLSAGGLISYYFSSRIDLADNPAVSQGEAHSFRKDILDNARQIWREKPFMTFVVKRFVYLAGIALASPMLTLYYVDSLKASDSSISVINMIASVTVIIGYFVWQQQTRKRGSRFVLLATTCGEGLFPILVALTHQVWLVILFAGIMGIFQAGRNLVLFDELMRRIPEEYSATFVAAAQALQYMSSIVTPLLVGLLADSLGFGAGLIVAGGISLAGFGLYLLEIFNKPAAAPQEAVPQEVARQEVAAAPQEVAPQKVAAR